MTHASARSFLVGVFALAATISCATRAQIKEGDALFERGDYAGASRSYEMAAKDNPEDEAIQLKWRVARVFKNIDEGRALVFEDRLLEAFERFEEAMRIDPRNETAPKWIEKAKSKFVGQKVIEGFDLLSEEDYSGATDSFQKALLYDPRSESALHGLEKIRTTLDQQLAKADNYLLRGVRDRAANLVGQAAANFRKAEDLNPADPEARQKGSEARARLAEQKFLEAQKLESDGHLGAALVQYRSIRAIDPQFPGLAEKVGQVEVELKARDLLARGKKLLLRGDFDGARLSFDEARKMMPSAGVIKAIEEALQETQEREISALYLAARNLEHASRFQEAVEKYEALLKKTSFHEDAIARLDLVRAAVAKAVESYEKGIRAEEAGEKAAALQAYQEIFAFYPKFRDVALRIEKLKQAP